MRPLGLALMTLIALLGVGCESSVSAPPPPTRIPFGTEAWGSDDCLYTAGFTQWLPSTWCRVEVAELTWDLYLHDLQNPGRRQGDAIWRADALDPAVDRYVSWSNGGVVGVRRSDRAQMVQTQFGWVTQDAYVAALAVAAQQPRGTPPPAAVAVDNQGRSVSRAEVDAMFGEINARVIARILAPDCNRSYNGCR